MPTNGSDRSSRFEGRSSTGTVVGYRTRRQRSGTSRASSASVPELSARATSGWVRGIRVMIWA